MTTIGVQSAAAVTTPVSALSCPRNVQVEHGELVGHAEVRVAAWAAICSCRNDTDSMPSLWQASISA